MFQHETVLKNEAVEGLQIKPDGTYVDCTVGGGGHTENIAARLNESGRIIGFDQDENALAAARQRLQSFGDRVLLIRSNFRHIESQLLAHGIQQVDGILFDLGVSSPQFDQGDRGFSYQHDAKLDMRMDQSQELSALEIVNEWSYQELAKIFFKYGEEKFSKQIARKIEGRRKKETITTTYQLVELIKDAIPAPARRKGGHPAKRVFQALRIAVNDELGAFDDALHQAARMTAIGGRVAVITFHSLEDRLCKQAFKKWSTPKETPRHLPIIPESHQPPFNLITRKPILPSENELAHNRRARSAKLRIAEKKKMEQRF
ncbi:16S rRNA (cytosine(1402)-N(4))-methyltransferase RsmH [Tigheibacillus jepli]|uniref:16S rRNA (cytosine(1402)-N(4))-methyltransferase RsmH n=1 Tax=Tigheibacillus jepli TaxID=3035914 RepID=UPI00387E189C